ncbi:hypothetical protein V494_00486 [Pseudogymnoascus sp. VKM F-4513 (FW-928)]|nr:hypothetical protein V494_00486 [Pseudogymnoascus sp. VKM F-4513 (FW-928)]
MGRFNRLMKKIARPFNGRSRSLKPGSGYGEKSSFPEVQSTVSLRVRNYPAQKHSAESEPPSGQSSQELLREKPPLLDQETTKPSTKSTSHFPPEIIRAKLQSTSSDYEPFKQLPAELFLKIANFLPLSSAASLTLTCRSSLRILGTQCTDLLQSSGWRWRAQFLYLLAKDMPGQIACRECQKIHSDTLHQLRDAAPVVEDYYGQNLSLYIHPEFDSHAFRQAMNLHHNGLDNREILSSLSPSGIFPQPDHTKQWEVKPKIVNGHYLIRCKTHFLYPDGIKGKTADIDTCICPGYYTENSHAVCAATKDFPTWGEALAVPTRLPGKLACRAKHWDDAHLNANCETCSGLFYCNCCPTEFELDTEAFGERGVALTITRWLDLGEGRSVTDQQYISHIFGFENCHMPYEPGYIKAAYERAIPDVGNQLAPISEKEIAESKGGAFDTTQAPALVSESL